MGHISPEAAEGGPIALVEDGDEITIDIPGRKITLHVSEEVLAERRKTLVMPKPKYTKGYLAVYAKMAASASRGAVIEIES